MFGFKKIVTDFFDDLFRADSITENKTKQIVTLGATLTGIYAIKKLFFWKKYDLKDKLVLITGGSQGIGAESAKLAAKNGAKVVILARNEGKLKLVKEEILKEEPNAIVEYYPVDCSDYEAVDQCIHEIIENKNLGVPYALINNAGAGSWKFLHESTKEDIENCIKAPLMASLFVTKAVLPFMIKKNEGSVIFVQSPAAFSSFGHATTYISARYGLHGLFEAIEADLYDTNIKVCEVCVSETESNYFVNNPGSHDHVPAFGKLLGKITPEKAAQGIINAILKGDTGTVFYPWQLDLATKLNGQIPSLVKWLTIKSGTRVKIN
eukprot:gene6157-10164_t